jgi:hypothetical protein
VKRLIKKTKGLIQGVPSAVLLSALIHVGLFFVAGTLVVFTVIKKQEKKFVPPPPIERPKMDLKKPKVKVKKTVKPRAAQRISASSVQSMPDIALPDVSRAGSGLSGGIGGFEMMPDPSEMSLFGGKSSMSIGNDFEGTFYSLQYDRQGKPTGISNALYIQEIRKFLENGWNPRVLTRFFRAPQKLYATQLMIPPITSEFGPSQFGMPWGTEFDPIHWCVHYKGKIANKEGGRFRFRGLGDDIMMVRVNGEFVADLSWDRWRYDASDWMPHSEDDRKYFIGHGVSNVGHWFELEPGVPADCEILIGEVPGGIYCAMLTIEKEGEDYDVNLNGMPILPVFRTAEIPEFIKDQIKYGLIEGEVDLDADLIFNVY